MVPEEPLTFEKITEVYRNEKQQKQLYPLPRVFYEQLRSYLAQREQELTEEARKDPNSVQSTLLRDDIKKVRKKWDQICQARERKLVLFAAEKVSGGEVSLKDLAREEETLFARLVEVLGDFRREAFEGLLSAQVIAPRSAPLEGAGALGGKAAEELLPLWVLEDLPPFVGIDSTHRLMKNDFVALPKSVARILIDKKKARTLPG